jgi:hypothetical protein
LPCTECMSEYGTCPLSSWRYAWIVDRKKAPA